MLESIKDYYKREMDIINSLNYEEIETAVKVLISAYKRDAIIYIFGNGGSATTASHFANDFNKGISENLQKKFKMLCLNDNIATITAIANDISYDEIFRFQLQSKLNINDLVIGISGSGNSVNVINGIKYAKEIGVQTIGITGFNGGMIYDIADFHLHCPIEDMQITEDIHMTFDHMMYQVIRDFLSVDSTS